MSLSTWVGLAAAAGGALELWRYKVGDAKARLGLDRIKNPQVHFFPDSRHALLSLRFPMRNVGRQQALIIDARVLLQPSGDRYSDLQPVARLINTSNPRSDGYWEAHIIKPGGELEVEIQLFLTAEDIRARFQELGTIRLDIHYKYYCRTPLKYCREELVMANSDFVEVPHPPVGPAPIPQAKPQESVPADQRVVPLRTHLLRAGENVVDVTARYLDTHGKPGDIVAWAESAVAIMQGRVVYCEDIRPRLLARKLNCLFGMNSSLSSVYALEMAMREVGAARMVLATAVGVAGKVMGRQGDVYRVAGRQVAAIDDCTGTLPPYDKHVVMGPERGEQLVAAIKARTGLDAAIVDANDLGKVDIFHISDPRRSAEVVEALKPNPQGNAGEMTPLVLIRKAE